MTPGQMADEAIDVLICADIPDYTSHAMLWFHDLPDETLAHAIAKRATEPMFALGLARALKWYANAWCEAVSGNIDTLAAMPDGSEH